MSGAKEVSEVHGVKEKRCGVAAFFDVDGTLVALPSLERRLFRTLGHQGEIPARNYLLWVKEAVRLMPRGINAVLQGNKMYLRGVEVFEECGERDGDVSSWHKGGHQARGQASATPSYEVRRHPRLPVPSFFARAIETVRWHAKQGHAIVLLSGTLEPLAREAARRLEAKLAAGGIIVTIRVMATRLKEIENKWTGKILGEAMFGEAKAQTARRLAAEMQLDLERCFAYGDSLNDRWLMEAIGRPAAVNPSHDLASVARTRGWPILHWVEIGDLTQRHASTLLRARRVNRETVEKRKNIAMRLLRSRLPVGPENPG